MNTLRKALAFSVLFILSNFSLSAQEKARPKLQSSLLWEVTGNGLSQPSYLFGTYHLIGKKFLDTLPGIMASFNKSKAVVGEVVLDDQMAMAQKLTPFMLLKNTSLDKVLTPQEHAEVGLMVESVYKNKLSVYNALKPVAIQLMLMVALAPQNITPLNPQLDMYFQSEAKAIQKPIYALETLEQQGELLFNGSLERQKELLLLTVRDSKRMIDEMGQMFKQYKEQDMEGIKKSILENKDYTITEMNDLLAKRNKNWMFKIPEMMNKESVFFAVGAGHLVGGDGLISLLRNAGYTVKPLPTK